MFLPSPRAALSPQLERRQVLIFFAIVGGILSTGMIGFYASGLHGSLAFPNDAAGYILGRDFLNTWFFGKAAFLSDPGRFYAHDLYTQWIAKIVPQDIFNHLWSYPPSFFLLAAPFGLLPYPLAFAAWTVVGLISLYATLRGCALRTLAILCSPAALFCLIGGQISFFMAAALLMALRWLDRRPLIAGVLIAFCTIKPQMGLLIPVLLMASRRWLVLGTATLGILCLVLCTGLIWGFDVWRDYVILGLPAQFADTRETYGVLAPWSPTITTALIMAGLKPETASILQIAFTVLGGVLVAAGCGKGPMDERRIALFLACSVFAAPYLLAHDLVALTAAAIMLAAAEPLDNRGVLAIKAVFFLPVLQFAGGLLHLPGAALIPVGFAIWASRQPRRVQEPTRPASPIAVS
jgi:hypothetical protein